MKKQILTIGVLLCTIVLSKAQVGVNTETPAATLDVVGTPADPAKLDGIIAPRLSGNELSTKTYTLAQTGALIYATAAADTLADQVVNVSAAGYYYFDGAIWVKTGGSDAEPWFDQDTNTEATANTQSIYQMGDVAINKDGSIIGVSLDVQGAVRGGSNSAIDVGLNSAGFGTDNIVAGENSLVTGQYNTLWGTGSAVFGADNIIGTAVNEGNWSLVAGLRNTLTNASRAYILGMDNVISNHPMGMTDNYILGSNNVLNGRRTYALGRDIVLTSVDQVAIGKQNAIQTLGSPTNGSPAITDPVFQVGVGNSGTGKNAMTILHNSYTGIGIAGTEAAAKPTEMLDIGSGNVRVRDINTNIGVGTTDRVVVADTNGVLKTLDFGSYTLFHARLTASQNLAANTITPLLLAVPLATSPIYTYNTGTGVMTFNQAGNYLVTMQASFTNISAGTQLLMGIRPFPDAPYLGRGSHYNAIANSGTIGELMNYTTMIIVPSAGYQVRFVAITNSSSTVLATEVGGTGTGNVTNVTVQKI